MHASNGNVNAWRLSNIPPTLTLSFYDMRARDLELQKCYDECLDVAFNL